MSFSRFRKQCEEIAREQKNLIEVPKNKQADLCIPCFSLGKDPVKIAQDLSSKMRYRLTKNTLVKNIENTGPYINFYIDEEKFSDSVLQDIIRENDNYGKGDKKEKIILEHTSMNPTGPVHVGRLRNSLIGDSLKRILEFFGHNIETHYYVDNMGKQVAIIAWGGKTKNYDDLARKYNKYKDKPDFKTMFRYVSSYYDATSSKENMTEVEELLRKAEQGDKDSMGRLRKTAQTCLDGQKASLERLGIEYDFFDFESKFIEDGSVKKILSDLEKKKLLKKQGDAVGVDLSSYGLKREKGLTILARSNGTSVYLLRDVAYHLEKLKKGRRIINVLGEDHKIEFQELKKIIELLNGSKNMEAVHYAFVNFKGMSLSTRKGETAPLDALIDEGIEKLKEKTDDKKLAESIATGAIKYHILKTDLQKQITFIWEDAINFDGNTGPYLQYSYVRAKSIMRKSKMKEKFKVLDMNKSDHELVKKISLFPEIVEKGAEEMRPSIIANYIYDLASQFNTYYHEEKIIGTDNEGAKLAVVKAFSIVMKNGMHLLGIDTPERM